MMATAPITGSVALCSAHVNCFSWPPAAALACAAVRHSRRLRCDTKVRHTARVIASAITKACWASSTSSVSTWPARCPRSRVSCMGRFVRPPFGTGLANAANQAITPGKDSAASTSRIHASGIARSSAQDHTIIRIDATGSVERRRLSSIFQRLSAVSGSGRSDSSHGSSCQSPRTQRCERAAATSEWDGESSKKAMSLTSAQRAKALSNRSWLSSVFSGTRPSRLAWNAFRSYRPLPVYEPSPKTSW